MLTHIDFFLLLPTEILEVVFSHLQQHDKVECLLVCRLWKEIIEQYTLYHTLFIETEYSLNEIIRKIQHDPFIGEKVERLVVSFKDHSFREELNQLFLSLPNLKVLHFLCKSFVKNVDYPWKRSIKEIVDFSRDGPAYHVTSSNELLRITAFRTVVRDNYYVKFKSMPLLTILDLSLFHASFSVLEILHDNLLQLKSFTIKSGTLYDFGRFDEEEIKPASTVTQCSFKFSDFAQPVTLETKLNLLNYICKKYPNLSTLSYDIKRSYIMNGDIYKLKETGWLPLFSSLGPSLKKLYISESEFIGGLFEMLDQSNCQIEDVKLDHIGLTTSASMIQSIQTNYIQSLEFKLRKDLVQKGFVWLKNFETLRKLKLSGENNGINVQLNDILDNSPSSLKTLSFRSICFTADLNCTSVYNIETLSFNAVILRKNVDTFISQHFQKLFKLKVKYCFIPENTLNLANMNISHFYFADTSNINSTTILTVCNGKQRFYKYKNSYDRRLCHMRSLMDQPRLFYLPFKSSTETKTKPDFTLSCHLLQFVTFTA